MTVKQFCDNTVSLGVQGSIALDPVRGNCRRRSKDREITVDDTPLPKPYQSPSPSPSPTKEEEQHTV